METTIHWEKAMKMIKGETLEKQIEHIDRILKSYSHRLHKTITGVITPFPISSYSETPIDNIVLRYMFPVDGRITVGGLFVEDMPKHGVDVTTTILQASTQISNTVFSKKQSIIVTPNVKVSAGDRLIIRVISVSSEETVSGIWIAFLWTPEVKDSVIKQFLIEDLEKNEEKMNALSEV